MSAFPLAHGGAEELGFNLEMMLIGGAAAAMGLKLRAERQTKPTVIWIALLAGVGLVIASFFVH